MEKGRASKWINWVTINNWGGGGGDWHIKSDPVSMAAGKDSTLKKNHD